MADVAYSAPNPVAHAGSILELGARAMAEANGMSWDHCAQEHWVSDFRTGLLALRRRFYAVEQAMLESRARDDEGEFPILLDILDYSGENKAHTVAAAAWIAAIDTICALPARLTPEAGHEA